MLVGHAKVLCDLVLVAVSTSSRKEAEDETTRRLRTGVITRCAKDLCRCRRSPKRSREASRTREAFAKLALLDQILPCPPEWLVHQLALQWMAPVSSGAEAKRGATLESLRTGMQYGREHAAFRRLRPNSIYSSRALRSRVKHCRLSVRPKAANSTLHRISDTAGSTEHPSRPHAWKFIKDIKASKE